MPHHNQSSKSASRARLVTLVGLVLLAAVLAAVLPWEEYAPQGEPATAPMSVPPTTIPPTPISPKPPKPSARVIYAVPSDRTMRPEFAEAIRAAVLHVQDWYTAQLDGYTFEVSGEIPQVCDLIFPASFYEGAGGWNKVVAGLQRCAPVKHFSPHHVWIIYPDVDYYCGGASELGRGGDGVAILHNGDLNGLIDPLGYHQCGGAAVSEYGWIGVLAHELSHAFGLKHPPGCDDGLSHCDEDALMWLGFYWGYPDTYLTEADIDALRASPFFRPRP